MVKEIYLSIKDIFYPRIIQFGPIRSGSTLVYNILRETYPLNSVLKRHKITYSNCNRYKTVVTYRNPLDSLASSIKKDKVLITEKIILKKIEELKNNGLNDLINIFENKNILKLKYEDFYNDINLIFDKLEIYFNKPISIKHREGLKKKYDIKNIILLTKAYKDFSQYDKVSQFHGNHISESKGKPNSFEELFNEAELALIKDALYPFISKLGY